MKKLRFWQSWSIGTRMAFITMLPVAFLFTSFVGYSWYSHRAQVAEELAERGRILAKALAETSEYNVISGNLADLRLTINGLVQPDKSHYRIDLARPRREGANRRPSRGARAARRSDSPSPGRDRHGLGSFAWRTPIGLARRNRITWLRAGKNSEWMDATFHDEKWRQGISSGRRGD